jgi:hypothetical protein
MGRVTVGEDNGTPVALYYQDHGSGPPVFLGPRPRRAPRTERHPFNAEVLASLRG